MKIPESKTALNKSSHDSWKLSYGQMRLAKGHMMTKGSQFGFKTEYLCSDFFVE